VDGIHVEYRDGIRFGSQDTGVSVVINGDLG